MDSINICKELQLKVLLSPPIDAVFINIRPHRVNTCLCDRCNTEIKSSCLIAICWSEDRKSENWQTFEIEVTVASNIAANYNAFWRGLSSSEERKIRDTSTYI